MQWNEEKLQHIFKEFTIDSEHLQMIAADFRYDLRKGLNNPENSSLRMLKSYLALPTGAETGDYLSLDFGGTNVRVLLIRLFGDGKYEILSKVSKPLKVEGIYDFVGEEATAEEMFDFIAALVVEALEGHEKKHYLLGHTFSFPSKQTNLYNAKLIIWTKEFAAKGVEGEVVNDLLSAALQRQGINNVEPVAVLNDTIAVLLAASYKHSDCYIASIYATGHNTCYFETFHETAEQPMILNLESGGFMNLVPNHFDIAVDKESEKPGEQRLEKMVAGRYMGELFARAVQELFDDPNRGLFTSIDLSNMVSDLSANRSETIRVIKERLQHDITPIEAEDIRDIAVHIIIRSARLVTASLVGILWQRSGAFPIQKQHIAIDGSVYEKMPLIKENINRALSELLKDDAGAVDIILETGGSALGGALAAAATNN